MKVECVKVKLCGMMRPEDIAAANALMPEYIGFVFWPKSFRNVSLETAAQLKAALDPSIRAVGVFVDPDLEFVKQLHQEGIIDIAQLHGSESDDEIRQLQEAGIPIIKAFVVKSEEDIALASASPAEYVLLDAGKGSGTAFNWNLIRNLEREFFLAGGLGPENIEQAVQTVRPYAVDVSSGIETDKQKDPAKMQAFVQNARNSEEQK